MTDDTLDNAYRACQLIAKHHYENFPTAARILSRAHYRATAAIYAFARSADDIADEGSQPADERHRQLEYYAQQLSGIASGDIPAEPMFVALADTINHYKLPLTPFRKLLTAFHQDIDTTRYDNYVDLANYCDHSANPVGELILRLHGIWNEESAVYSNCICTALQLINFTQDISSDYRQRGRLYIPLSELQEFAVDESVFALQQNDHALNDLINYQIQRAYQLLHEGVPLVHRCPWRLKLILKITIISAERILEKLSRRKNVFARPVLEMTDYALIGARSLMFQSMSRS